MRLTALVGLILLLRPGADGRPEVVSRPLIPDSRSLLLEVSAMAPPEKVRQVLEVTQPLQFPRGDRLPLFLWPCIDVGTPDDAETIAILRTLDERGIAAVTSWNNGDREGSLAEGLRIARMQSELGMEVCVNANSCLHQFFNGDPGTAHISAEGEPFFDSSFSAGVKMGCPFALDFRVPAIREQVEFFSRGYAEAGLKVDFAFADWEIDGPIEWNGAWEASRRCRRCRENIPDIEDFHAFQTALRAIRSDLQRQVFAEPMKACFPDVLVGNYAEYPNDGRRYWYDYFEQLEGPWPYEEDQRARYRPWYPDFARTGYTFAMPVVYTWYPTFLWYDFDNPDYRWFYNLLRVATNAARHTPREIPIISFVHWHTTSPPQDPDPAVLQFSAEKYQELLWHMLLRGADGLFLWCPQNEAAEEVDLLHTVYAEALQYRDFLERGEPINLEYPGAQDPIVSGLRLGERILVRRTDFDDRRDPVPLRIDGRILQVHRKDGECQVLEW